MEKAPSSWTDYNLICLKGYKVLRLRDTSGFSSDRILVPSCYERIPCTTTTYCLQPLPKYLNTEAAFIMTTPMRTIYRSHLYLKCATIKKRNNKWHFPFPTTASCQWMRKIRIARLTLSKCLWVVALIGGMGRRKFSPSHKTWSSQTFYSKELHLA